MTQQVFRSEKAEANVGRPRPFLQQGRIEVVLRRGPIVQDRDRDLAALERYHLRKFSCAYHAVVPGDRLVAIYAEVRQTIAGGIRKILPGRPSLAVILRLLQNPESWPGRIAHSHVNISHMEFLRNKNSN